MHLPNSGMFQPLWITRGICLFSLDDSCPMLTETGHQTWTSTNCGSLSNGSKSIGGQDFYVFPMTFQWFSIWATSGDKKCSNLHFPYVPMIFLYLCYDFPMMFLCLTPCFKPPGFSSQPWMESPLGLAQGSQGQPVECTYRRWWMTISSILNGYCTQLICQHGTSYLFFVIQWVIQW